MAKSIYLDYASSARINEANPGAIHELGLKEKQKLEKARKTVAGILGAHADEIIFTSGATESNNLAILGAPRGHIITTNIEHASVLEACRHRGHATFVEVEQSGIVDPKKIKKALRPDTVLVSVMYANNEIGTIQPIREIAKEIRHYNKLKRPDLKNSPRSGLGGRVIFHTDATQAMNYLPINVEKLGVDLMSFNAAKIYGPKGVGVLYKRRKVKLSPIMCGGNQEFGLRPGTENVAGIVGLGKACELAVRDAIEESPKIKDMRDYLYNGLESRIEDVKLNGHPQERLPNTVNVGFKYLEGESIVLNLDMEGVAVSTGSACTSGSLTPSHVLRAMGIPFTFIQGSVRFSLSRYTSEDDVDYIIKNLPPIIWQLREISPFSASKK